MDHLEGLSPQEAVAAERLNNVRDMAARIERKLDAVSNDVTQLKLTAAMWKGTVRGVMIAAPALGGLLGLLASLLFSQLRGTP